MHTHVNVLGGLSSGGYLVIQALSSHILGSNSGFSPVELKIGIYWWHRQATLVSFVTDVRTSACAVLASKANVIVTNSSAARDDHAPSVIRIAYTELLSLSSI